MAILSLPQTDILRGSTHLVYYPWAAGIEGRKKHWNQLSYATQE